MKSTFLKSFQKTNLSIVWTVLGAVFVFLGENTAYAQRIPGGSNNMTSTDFTINLSAIDPVHSGGSVPGGMGAFGAIMETVSGFLLAMIPIIAAIGFLIAGYFYIFSFTDGENVTKAKTIIKYNLMAIAVAFFSYAIIQAIVEILK